MREMTRAEYSNHPKVAQGGKDLDRSASEPNFLIRLKKSLKSKERSLGGPSQLAADRRKYVDEVVSACKRRRGCRAGRRWTCVQACSATGGTVSCPIGLTLLTRRVSRLIVLGCWCRGHRRLIL